ncbi:MAG: tetratricopeptide repeat protein [Planctomycetota bacterium]
MSELVTHDSSTTFRVSIWHHAATVVLVFGFIALGWLRLNDCDLFNPDSPRYLIYAQSLAETGQYRAIDTPGAPLYTWRPPGLPILLAPVLRFLPYDVVAAKWVVLLSGALLLWAVHAIASMTRGGWSGPLMVAAVGSSPMFLSLATEVLTEVPYALGTLAVVYGLGRWDFKDGTVRKRAFLCALVAVAFTPIIRTIGVAMVAAAAGWSLLNRRRWMFLPAIVVAVSGLVWLALRSRLAPGTNYAGSLIQNIREQGLMAVLTEAIATLGFYASVLPGVAFPGLTSGQPFYAPMVVGPLPQLENFGLVAGILTTIFAFVGVLGFWQQRARGGLVVLMYLPLYVGCLSIWPWRHERFLWPLLPFLWAFFPSGCAAVGQFIPAKMRVACGYLIAALLVGLSGWQVNGEMSLVTTNQRFSANRDEFSRSEAPGFYFSDWRLAGRWIKENTPANSRLLAWQAAVGGTAHRFQRRVQFETLDPEKIRSQISSFPARYLVIANCQFGLGFGWQQVFADPEYKLTPVYNDRGVVVLEVSPNLTGTIDSAAYRKWVDEQRLELDRVLSQHPDRTDLLIRKADLLQEQGDNQQAIDVLKDLNQRGVITVKVCSSLGWLYLTEGQYELASQFLELARGLPNAEPVAQSLAEGAELARERMNQASDLSLDESHERSIRRIRSRVTSLQFPTAEREVNLILEKSPDHVAAIYWRGYLWHLIGDLEKAEAAYDRAARLGSTDAAGKRHLLRLARTVAEESNSTLVEEASEGSKKLQQHLELAKLYTEQGWSGRSITVLEGARMRFGDRPEILVPLAELYLKFARPDQALPLLKIAHEAWPHEKSVRQALAVVEGALREPQFP